MLALIRNFQRIPQKLEVLGCGCGISCLGLTEVESIALQRTTIRTLCWWHLRNSENRKCGYSQIPIYCHPHLAPMNVCKQKFSIPRYFNLPLPLIHCHKLGWTAVPYQGLTVYETGHVMFHINLPDQIHVGTVEKKVFRSPRYVQSDK